MVYAESAQRESLRHHANRFIKWKKRLRSEEHGEECLLAFKFISAHRRTRLRVESPRRARWSRKKKPKQTRSECIETFLTSTRLRSPLALRTLNLSQSLLRLPSLRILTRGRGAPIREKCSSALRNPKRCLKIAHSLTHTITWPSSAEQP